MSDPMNDHEHLIDLLERARRSGAVASPDGTFDEDVRLPFGQRPDIVEEGVRRLARAWQAYAPMDESQPSSMAVIV